MFDKKNPPLLPNTNNFQKAGIKNELTNIDDSESGSDDDELPLSRLVNIRNTLGEIGVTLEEVVAGCN